jgi:hypothetical protein
MLRLTRVMQVGFCLWVTMCCVWSCLADGGPPIAFYKEVSPGDYLVACYPLFAETYLVTVLVEYVAVYWLLGRPAAARMSLLLYLLLINLLTNPVAQLGMLFLGDPVLMGSRALAQGMDCVIELTVVVVEFGLMKWIFSRMYRNGLLAQPITALRTLVMALVANLASFAVGTVGVLLIMAAFCNAH